MPSSLTYPGVYVEEIPSGVRTIAGVSTSVTAFVGATRSGPINRAIRVLSFADFERRFGGLEADSELSYAVRQFFLNGGSEAWVVRLAKDAKAAQATLNTGGATPVNVLVLTAREQGRTGNAVELQVDHQARDPVNEFNLTVVLAPADNPAATRVEAFRNLSLNPRSPRYALTVINAESELVTARLASTPVVPTTSRGTSRSDALTSFASAITAATRRIRVSCNGRDPVPVTFSVPTATIADACTTIRVALNADPHPAYQAATCAPDGNRILITSGEGGAESTVRVLPGETEDASANLKLGPANGGTETDAVSGFRPGPIPGSGRLTGAAVTTLAAGEFGRKRYFRLKLDELPWTDVVVDAPAAVGATLAERRNEMAALIQRTVHELKSFEAFKAFECRVDATTGAFELRSGTRGAGSSVQVMPANDPAASPPAPDPLLTTLRLTPAETTSVPGTDVTLTGGDERPFGKDDEAALYTGNRSLRTGMYALEAVDLFNLLCLPGVTQNGVLSEAVAYCEERRALLLIDAPIDKKGPDEMEAFVTGTALPKHRNATVYFPWVHISDPLSGGRLRTIAPCGTIAGLCARTDSTRGVWKAPAGTEATLTGVQGLAYNLTDLENGVLNPRGVNCLRLLPSFGAVAWGARTLRGDDQMADEWKYLPVRRLALFLEESLFRGLKWVVFEPNDEPLWAQIRLNVGAFMQGLFRQGAFQGQSPREAYFVKCDKETTTQNDINLGIVNIVVGFAPLKPAEFVVLKLQQMAGQIAT